tara:strand:+ start:2229 stop:2426 length:198 start_codon:yes stop_codon:yes gene_type:complete
MNNKTKTYTYWGNSESGDSYGPVTFSRKLTKLEEKKMVHSWDGDYDFKGCGTHGSWVHLESKSQT